MVVPSIWAISPSGSGNISTNPSSPDGYYDSGASVQITASANTGFTFLSWSGDLTGTTNPTYAAVARMAINMQSGDSLTKKTVGMNLRFIASELERIADNLDGGVRDE